MLPNRSRLLGVVSVGAVVVAFSHPILSTFTNGHNHRYNKRKAFYLGIIYTFYNNKFHKLKMYKLSTTLYKYLTITKQLV